MDSRLKARELEASYRDGELIYCVHYSCENLYKAEDHPAIVSCIAISTIGESGYTAWSPADYDLDGAHDKAGSAAEKRVLESYFEFLRSSGMSKIIHWNMSSSDYGFEALENRFRYVGLGDPYIVPKDRLYDSDDLIAVRFGARFADHPKLFSTAILNGVNLRHALKGEVEAESALSGNHAAVKRSTADKVRAIATLAERFFTGALVTKNSTGAVEFARVRVDVVDLLSTVADRMLYVSRELGLRYGDRSTLKVEDEYDSQDLFRSLLRLFFEDVRAEDWSPEYAGGASRIDFVLPRQDTAVEIKHTRQTLNAKRLGEELIIDAVKYAAHPNVRHLVCLVFDHDGYIDNPRGIESDLSSRKYADGAVSVTVRIVDR